MTSPDLSVVIPAYNEERVLEQTLRDILAFLGTTSLRHEIVVADDGSSDATAAIAAAVPGVRVLRGEHRGKGDAVRRGMLAAAGRWRLFMDADHATRIEEWTKLEPWLARGHQVVIGSRKMAGAQITTHQSFVRESMGKVFTQLTNLLLPIGVSDITCGFKAFARPAAEAVFPLQHLDGWGFDAEILYLARRCGYTITEVPVVWQHHEGTKVRLLRDAVRSFSEILAIRRAERAGRYGQPAGERRAEGTRR